MASICASTAAITSIAQLSAAFPDSVLPPANAQRSADDRLTEGALSIQYDSLTRAGKLLSLDAYRQKLAVIRSGSKDDVTRVLESIGTVETKTMNDLQREFCFYYVRYRFALQDLFDTIVLTSKGTALTEQQKTTINTKMAAARDLNRKLNDIIQIVNFIAKKRASEMRQQNEQINALNSQIGSLFSNLKEANNLLKREDSIADLRKRMVEYTQEKNLSANNLLSLYGFLNLVALGLLFYIARKV